MDVTQHKRQGLLGFAIEREGPGRKHRWLRGLLRFPGQVGEKLTPIDSKVAPLQKFRWSDYSVYPATSYRYRVHGVYGNPQMLRLKRGGEVSIRTESLDKGLHESFLIGQLRLARLMRDGLEMPIRISLKMKQPGSGFREDCGRS